MYDEEEVPNTKCMHIVEGEVSLSQPKTIAVPPEEEEVPVPHGPSIVVPPEEEVPLEEEEVPAPTSWSHRRKRRSQPPCCGPVGRKGMPYLSR
jgi:hypothetical protein